MDAFKDKCRAVGQSSPCQKFTGAKTIGDSFFFVTVAVLLTAVLQYTASYAASSAANVTPTANQCASPFLVSSVVLSTRNPTKSFLSSCVTWVARVTS